MPSINNPVNAQIQGLQNFNSSTGVWTGRTLTSSNSSISITNGDGTSGNPDLIVNGSLVGQTITGDVGGALSPTAGNWNIISNVSAINSGSSVAFSGAVSTLTLNLTDSNHNTMIGNLAGNSSITASENTALGYQSLKSLNNIAAIRNTCIGSFSGLAITSGQANTGVGWESFFSLSTGSNNTAIGYEALQSLSTGSGNTALGYFAGSGYTAAESSNISIGNNGTGGESNTIRIGTQGSGSLQQNKCFIAGIVGVTNSNPQIVTINSSTGQLGVTSSSELLWNVVSTNQTGATSNGYIFVSPGGALTISLPTTSSVGDTFAVALDGATSWQITQAAGQQIRISSSTTTLGATGTLTSTAQGDSVTLVCRVANTLWTAVSMIGNLTPA